MKASAIIMIFCLLTKAHAQKIFIDSKDKFTGIHTIATYPEKIMPLGGAMVTGVKIIDSVGTKYQLGISNTFSFDVITSKPDSVAKGLWLILDTGSIVELKWENTAVMDKVTTDAAKMYSSSFNVSSDAIQSLVNNSVTDVRMIGDKGHILQFEVGKKFRGTISKILNLLISKN